MRLQEDDDYFEDLELEVARAEITRKEFDLNQERWVYSYIVLSFLMFVQTSCLLNKFLIGSAYNYDGDFP